MENVQTASMINFPGITMPWGRSIKSGVPFGMEIDTITGNDKRLLQIAKAIEEKVIKPRFSDEL
jgi:Asp-tRNA(Asn)/Glu-tRNA(Gln) amidotransferase A subunit family amidase